MVPVGPRSLFAITAISGLICVLLFQFFPDQQPSQEMLTKVYVCSTELKRLKSDFWQLSEEKEDVDILYQDTLSKMVTLEQQWTATKKVLEEVEQDLALHHDTHNQLEVLRRENEWYKAQLPGLAPNVVKWFNGCCKITLHSHSRCPPPQYRHSRPN